MGIGLAIGWCPTIPSKGRGGPLSYTHPLSDERERAGRAQRHKGACRKLPRARPA
jgi:hypothetical protein